MPHSPTPWVFKEAGGDEIIEDANGRRVHYDTQYYPSGLESDDAKFIVRSVNRVAELEAKRMAIIRHINAVVWNFEHSTVTAEEHERAWRNVLAEAMK